MFLKKLLYPALLFFFITNTIIICLPDGAHATISAYMPYYAVYEEVNGTNTYSYIIIRRFKLNNTGTYLCINPYTLTTGLLKPAHSAIKKQSLQSILAMFPNSPYATLYSLAQKNSKRMFNAGITHFNQLDTIVVSFDLCPSKKQLDTRFIEQFIDYNKNQLPAPVTICISGNWLLKHEDDLQWLKQLAFNKQLDIVWVNHSYSHFYSRSLPIKKNFLLKEGTNIACEVLQNEKIMLEHNIIPSIFFRFPGLVSNQKIYSKVMDYGLIPLGSDAWLAKGKMPRGGSILLVHLNGNDKKGTRILLQYMQSVHQPGIIASITHCNSNGNTCTIKKQTKL